MLIRVARTEDAVAMSEIYAPIVRDTFISFETEPPSVAEMARRVEATLQDYPWLVIEEAGRAIAYAYAREHRTRQAYSWACDVSVYVGERARRRGLARMLYKCLFELLVAQGLKTAYAGIALPNAASVALHEDLGFKCIGVYEGASSSKILGRCRLCPSPFPNSKRTSCSSVDPG